MSNNLISQTSETCNHVWIPVEYVAGARRYQQDQVTKDWSSNIINAHYLRVTKLWCPRCNRFLQVPSDARNK